MKFAMSLIISIFISLAQDHVGASSTTSSLEMDDAATAGGVLRGTRKADSAFPQEALELDQVPDPQKGNNAMPPGADGISRKLDTEYYSDDGASDTLYQGKTDELLHRNGQPISYTWEGKATAHLSGYDSLQYSYHPDCGWWGCRLAQHSAHWDVFLWSTGFKLDHQKEQNWRPNDWQFDIEAIWANGQAGDLKIGDKVRLKFHGQYIVANGRDEVLRSDSNMGDRSIFYIRSAFDDSGNKLMAYRETLKYGDPFVLAYTGEGYETTNCGWYGCRVMDIDGNNQLELDHGKYAYALTFF